MTKAMDRDAAAARLGPRGRVRRRTIESTIGVLIAIAGAVYWYLTRQYDPGSIDLPGPAFFPPILGASLVVLGAIVAVTAIARDDGTWLEIFGGSSAVVMLLLIVGTVAMPVLGSRWALPLLAIALFRLVGELPWLKAMLAGALLGFGAWYVMSLAQFQMP